MKKIELVYVDGFYRTKKELKKLYPNGGYSTTFTKTEYRETLAERIQQAEGKIFFVLVVLALVCLEVVLVLKYLGII